MNTNLQSQIPAAHSLSSEGTVVGVVGAVALLVKKLLSAKPAKPEPMGRADFYAELAALKDHIHTGHLAILEKLDANHRELLAALDRQATRINAVESGLARVDERTRSNHERRFTQRRVRTRSTASLTSPAMFGTRWNRVPTGQTILARAIWLALPATRAVSTTKQKKESNV